MFAIKWSLCALVAVALAQSNQFTSPDGREDDFSVGDNLDIRWQAGWTGSGLRQNNVDLFVTGSKSGAYTSVLRRNISLDQPGNYRWKIDIPLDILRKDKDFVVAFVQARDPPNFDAAAGIGTSSSREFEVEEDSKSSGSKGKGKKNKRKSKLGAILGGVLGGLALLIGALVTALAVLRSKRKKKQQLEAGKDVPPPPPPPVEQQKYASTAEMHAMRAREHDAPPKYEPPAELQGSEALKDDGITKEGEIMKDGETSRKDGEVKKDVKEVK